MKKILLLALFFVSAGIFAQTQKTQPLVLADGMLAPSSWAQSKNKNIASVNVYKANLPADLKNFSSYLADGVINIKLKDNKIHDKISLGELNQSMKLDTNAPVMYDGRTFSDTSVKIIGDAIVNMKVAKIDGKDVLTISSIAQ